MAYLTLRCDESENVQVGRPHIFTVSGWLAEVGDWEDQRQPWNAAMERWGLTRRGFHMTDFIAGYEEYGTEDWQNRGRKKSRYDHLCKLILRNKLHGFSSSVNAKDYDEVLTPELASSGLKSRYYGFNIVRILEDVEEWVDAQNYPEPISIHYVFAKRRGLLAEIEWLFDKIAKDAEWSKRFRLAPIPWAWGDMQKDARLQPADILACLSNRRAVRFAERIEVEGEGCAESPETDGWLLTLAWHLGGNNGIFPPLYNNKKTLLRWMERMAEVEDVISPDRKGSEREGLKE